MFPFDDVTMLFDNCLDMQIVHAVSNTVKVLNFVMMSFANLN